MSLSRFKMIPFLMVGLGLTAVLVHQNCGRVEFRRDGFSNSNKKPEQPFVEGTGIRVTLSNGINQPIPIGQSTCTAGINPQNSESARDVRMLMEVTRPGDNEPGAFWCLQSLPDPNPNFSDSGTPAEPGDDEPQFVDCDDLVELHTNGNPPLYNFKPPGFDNLAQLDFNDLNDGFYEFRVYATQQPDGNGWATDEVTLSFRVCDCNDAQCNPNITTTTLDPNATTSTTLDPNSTSTTVTTTTLDPNATTTTTLDPNATTTTSTTLPGVVQLYLQFENLDKNLQEEDANGDPTGDQIKVIVVNALGVPVNTPSQITFVWEPSYFINGIDIPDDQKALEGVDFVLVTPVTFLENPLQWMINFLQEYAPSIFEGDRIGTIEAGANHVNLQFIATLPDSVPELNEKVRFRMSDPGSLDPNVLVGISNINPGVTYTIVDNDAGNTTTTTMNPNNTTTTTLDPNSTTTTMMGPTTTTLAGPTTTTLMGPTTTTTLIDTVRPSISIFGPNPSSGAEGNVGSREVEFKVRLNKPAATGTTATVHAVVIDQTADYNSDYVCYLPSPPPVTPFAASLQAIIRDDFLISFSGMETEKTVVCRINGDLDFESDETFQIVLGDPTEAVIVNPTSQTYTIVNDDVRPVVEIEAVTQMVTEGGNLSVRAKLDKVSLVDVTVVLSTEDFPAGACSSILCPATENVDYQAVSSQVVTIPAGQMVSNTISIVTLSDNFDEFIESLYSIISNPTNATLGNAMVKLDILDDPNDVAPTVRFEASPHTDTEGNTVSFRLMLSGASGKPISFDLNSVNGTAVSGSDFTFANTTVQIAPGNIYSGNQSVQFIADGVYEPLESFNINMSNFVNVSSLNPTGMFRIVEADDQRPLVSIHQPNPSVLSEEGPIPPGFFKIVLSKRVSFPVTVIVKDSQLKPANKATLGKDYAFGVNALAVAKPLESIEVTIPANQLEAMIPVTIFNDKLVEPLEVFGFNLVMLTYVQDPGFDLGNPIAATYQIDDSTDQPFVGFEVQEFEENEYIPNTRPPQYGRRFKLLNENDEQVFLTQPASFKIRLNGMNIDKDANPLTHALNPPAGPNISQGEDYAFLSGDGSYISFTSIGKDEVLVQLTPKPADGPSDYNFFTDARTDYRVEDKEQHRLELFDPVGVKLKIYTLGATPMIPFPNAMLTVTDSNDSTQTVIGFNDSILNLPEGTELNTQIRIYYPPQYVDVTGVVFELPTSVNDTVELESMDPDFEVIRNGSQYSFVAKPKLPILPGNLAPTNELSGFSAYPIKVRSIADAVRDPQVHKFGFKDLKYAREQSSNIHPFPVLEVRVIERDNFGVRAKPANAVYVAEGLAVEFDFEIYSLSTGLAVTNHPTYTVAPRIIAGSTASANDFEFMHVIEFRPEGNTYVVSGLNSFTIEAGQSFRRVRVNAIVNEDSYAPGAADLIERLALELTSTSPIDLSQAKKEIFIQDSFNPNALQLRVNTQISSLQEGSSGQIFNIQVVRADSKALTGDHPGVHVSLAAQLASSSNPNPADNNDYSFIRLTANGSGAQLAQAKLTIPDVFIPAGTSSVSVFIQTVKNTDGSSTHEKLYMQLNPPSAGKRTIPIEPGMRLHALTIEEEPLPDFVDAHFSDSLNAVGPDGSLPSNDLSVISVNQVTYSYIKVRSGHRTVRFCFLINGASSCVDGTFQQVSGNQYRILGTQGACNGGNPVESELVFANGSFDVFRNTNGPGCIGGSGNYTATGIVGTASDSFSYSVCGSTEFVESHVNTGEIFCAQYGAADGKFCTPGNPGMLTQHWGRPETRPDSERTCGYGGYAIGWWVRQNGDPVDNDPPTTNFHRHTGFCYSGVAQDCAVSARIDIIRSSNGIKVYTRDATAVELQSLGAYCPNPAESPFGIEMIPTDCPVSL